VLVGGFLLATSGYFYYNYRQWSTQLSFLYSAQRCESIKDAILKHDGQYILVNGYAITNDPIRVQDTLGNSQEAIISKQKKTKHYKIRANENSKWERRSAVEDSVKKSSFVVCDEPYGHSEDSPSIEPELYDMAPDVLNLVPFRNELTQPESIQVLNILDKNSKISGYRIQESIFPQYSPLTLLGTLRKSSETKARLEETGSRPYLVTTEEIPKFQKYLTDKRNLSWWSCLSTSMISIPVLTRGFYLLSKYHSAQT